MQDTCADIRNQLYIALDTVMLNHLAVVIVHHKETMLLLLVIYTINFVAGDDGKSSVWWNAL